MLYDLPHVKEFKTVEAALSWIEQVSGLSEKQRTRCLAALRSSGKTISPGQVFLIRCPPSDRGGRTTQVD